MGGGRCADAVFVAVGASLACPCAGAGAGDLGQYALLVPLSSCYDGIVKMQSETEICTYLEVAGSNPASATMIVFCSSLLFLRKHSRDWGAFFTLTNLKQCVILDTNKCSDISLKFQYLLLLENVVYWKKEEVQRCQEQGV